MFSADEALICACPTATQRTLIFVFIIRAAATQRTLILVLIMRGAATQRILILVLIMRAAATWTALLDAKASPPKAISRIYIYMFS